MEMSRRYSLFLLYGKLFRMGVDVGRGKNCAERFVQHRPAADANSVRSCLAPAVCRA